MKKIKTRTITPACVFDCEMIIGPDASEENLEIRKISDEAIAIFIDKHWRWIDISEFKNAANQTIGEYLLENHEDFVIALANSD